MWKLVKKFIQSCETCAKTKVPQHQLYGLFHLLLVPKDSWLLFSLDFIINLLLVNGNNSILVVVNWLTKMAHFIPCNKTVTGEETTKLFIENIYCTHRLPYDIISNRGTQFISNFWRGYFQLLGMKINLFTVYHPYTNEQTKRENQILEQYLCCIVNYQQDDWTNFLYLAEFVYNNTIHSSTKQTPFIFNYGHHPGADPFQIKDVESLAAKNLATHLAAIHDELAFQLYGAQDHYKDYADRNQKIHPNFHIENQVWLLR